MNFSVILFIPLVLTILSSIIFFKRYSSSPIKIAPIFLICSLLIEIIAIYAERKFENNMFVYDIYTILEFIFYSFIFYFSIENIIIKKTIIVWCIIFIVSIFLYYFNIYRISESNLLSLIISYIFIIFFSCIYLNQLLLNDAIIKYYHIPLFWISLAALYCVSIFGFSEFINFKKYYIPYNIDFIIKVIGLYGYYILLNIAFICRR